MRKSFIILGMLISAAISGKAAFLHNEYSYLQDITFELYTDDVPPYRVPETIKSIEETLMFEILHATWKDKHWVAYTLNKNLLGTFKVGQPALMDDGGKKKLYFVAAFPGSVGGLDLYVSEFTNGAWSKPKNLGKSINTEKNESNPGLLNDHTLTYSSGGIIKKLNLNTLQVVDLEEAMDEKPTTTRNDPPVKKQEKVKRSDDPLAAIGDNSTAVPAGSPANTNDYGAIGDNSTAMPRNTESSPAPKQAPAYERQNNSIQSAPVQQKEVAVTRNTSDAEETMAAANVNTSVQSLGSKSREEMLSKYKTAIQLGAFSTPKWEAFSQFSKYGKLVSYKNEKNMNVVWLTGFASRTAAEAALQEIKSTPGFEGAYITGK